MDLDDLAQRIARLEALESIRRVALDYCVAADHRDEARWLAAWTKDAVWQVSPDRAMNGHQQILAGGDIRPSWPLEELAALVPDASIETVPGAPHDLWSTHPVVWFDAVSRAYTEVLGAGAGR